MTKGAIIRLSVALSGGIALTLATGIPLLKDFVFENPEEGPETSAIASSNSGSSQTSSGEASEGSSSSTGSTSSTSSAPTTISYEKGTYGNSIPYHYVDISLSDLSHLRTHVVTDSNGRPGANIKATVSSQIKSVSGDGTKVLAAINGDYAYYTKKSGYVIRNGTTWRSKLRSGSDATNKDFSIFNDGTISSYYESQVSFADLTAKNGGVWQNFEFGPTLIENGSIVPESELVLTGKSTASNPRTALGYLGSNHFSFFVSEATDRYSENGGLSLKQEAAFLLAKGCQYAYNLDGGGSTTMVVNGNLVNDPSEGSEREVSDMVYVCE